MLVVGADWAKDSKDKLVGAEEGEPRAESTFRPAASQKFAFEGEASELKRR